jgi:AcrR family transcriptional regulator
MGNREELLKGARECLLEKGYVQTTARDIARASGVGLAAIGYHFGTKEALLQEAMVEANMEWGERIGARVASIEPPRETPFSEWFEQCWGQIINASQEDQRLLQASFEVLLNVDQSTPVCASIENGMQCGRNALVELFGHKDENFTADERHALGSFYHALMIGVRLLHAAAPDRAPNPHELALAMQIIGQKFCDAKNEAEPASEPTAAAQR